MYVEFFFFFFVFVFFFLCVCVCVWNYYFISARWLPPLRINKVKVKVPTINRRSFVARATKIFTL